ncbi:hypothetical protein ACOSP7_017506 [Xanthoceras sorbifolium]
MLWATQSKIWYTIFPVVKRSLRMEHYVLNNWYKGDRSMPLYDIMQFCFWTTIEKSLLSLFSGTLGFLFHSGDEFVIKKKKTASTVHQHKSNLAPNFPFNSNIIPTQIITIIFCRMTSRQSFSTY